MKKYNKTIYSFLLIYYFVQLRDCAIFSNGCDPNCVCDITQKNLTIKCNVPFNRKFLLPNVFTLIENTTTIIVKDSKLINYPTNICQYSTKLTYLDLSDNQIVDNLNGTLFDCLKKLEYLDLSNNSISNIDENSFNYLNNLKELDLSFNKIGNIPFNLFYFKLPNLTHLYLRNNQLKELDIWILFLKSINYIDLRYNQISKFSNSIKWSFYFVSPFIGLANTDLVDLRFNNITRFDDNVLRLYSICTQTDFWQFLDLFSKLLFDDNNIDCDCFSSFNLLTFYQWYITKYTIKSTDYLFFHKCSTPGEYYDRDIFSFINPVICSDIGIPFSSDNCGYSTTSTRTTSTTTQTNLSLVNNPQNLIESPKTSLNETNIDYFNDAQIAGYVIGLFGILILFLILMYCICPVEILSVCFSCFPCCYRLCPCKSGILRNKDKKYDLFVCYNRVNESWVRNKLVPFIRENKLLDDYVIYYNQNKFNIDIRDKMYESNCILLVLSDAFLMKEWNNEDFKDHLRYLVTKEKTRFMAIQMHDVCDEEVEEYFTNKLQIPRFVSLENDEFFFWKKLTYFLYANNPDDESKSNRKVYVQDKPKPVKTKPRKVVPKTKPNIELFDSRETTPRKLPQLPKKTYLLDEIYTADTISNKVPPLRFDLKTHHENYDNISRNSGRSRSANSRNSIFTSQDDNDFKSKNKERRKYSARIIEADYTSKLKDDSLIQFRNYY